MQINTYTGVSAGFKYIGNTSQRLETEGFNVPFGYEEAIGFMIGSTVRDKDGVSASVRPTPSLVICRHRIHDEPRLSGALRNAGKSTEPKRFDSLAVLTRAVSNVSGHAVGAKVY